MTKYKLSKQELQDHWDDQIRFIQKSIKEFDRGDEKEAQRLATHLRVLIDQKSILIFVFHEIKPADELQDQIGRASCRERV